MISYATDYPTRLKEIELALLNNDLDRVSRRTMDLTHDFICNESDKISALDLREQYNNNKALGSSGNANIELRQEYDDLIASLKSDIFEPVVETNVNPVICVAEGIGKTYGSFELQEIDIKLEKGKIVGLVGENGNGKTTLLRLLSGQLHMSRGSLSFYNGDEKITTWERTKKEIAFIPQRTARWWGTLEEQISFSASLKGIKGKENLSGTNFIIQRLGLTKFKNHTWSELSSGYKLRAEIAKALVWNPRVLILDEPLANLDLLAQELLLQDIKDLAESLRKPVSIILSSQQLHEVETIADQIIFLKNGRAVFNGRISELNEQEDYHTVEIDGNLDYEILSNALSTFEVRIEKNVSGFTLNISKTHNINEVLNTLIAKNFELNYYRNITNSTKKLFNDKY